MKKSMYTFGILALMLAGAACNNSDNGDPQGDEFPDGIQPVVLADELGDELGEELTAFFEEKLMLIGHSIFGEDNDALLIGGGDYPDTCVMINSVEEFQTINFSDFESADMTFELPPIDFDVYTLVIGQYGAPSHGVSLVEHRVVIESKEITMNILLKSWDTLHTTDTWKKEYWGLYPKLPQLPIRVVRKFQ